MGVAVLLALWGLASGPLPVRLDWSAPSGCPSSEAVARELAPELAVTSTGTIQVSARIDRTAAAWHLHLEVVLDREPRARIVRELDGETCGALAKAAVLFAKLGAQEVSVLEAPPLPPPTAPAVVETPPEIAVIVGVTPMIELGTFPGPSGGVIASAGVILGAWRLEAGFIQRLPVSYEVTSSPPQGARFSGTAASMRGCYAIVDPLEACARVTAGVSSATGTTGVLKPETLAVFMGTAGLGIGAELPLSDTVRLTGLLEAAARSTRPHYQIDGRDIAFRPAPVSVFAAIGVEATIW